MENTALALLVCSFLLVLGISLAGCTGTPGANGEIIPPLPTQSSVVISPAPGNTTGVSEADNQFSYDLYQQLANRPGASGGNIFFSPYSISSALAITYEGARGTTADEIRSVFHFPADDTIRRQGFASINGVINSRDSGYSLDTANALWAEKTFAFLPEYTGIAGQWYSANVTNLDFTGQPDNSRLAINSWVGEKTNNKIQDLLPPGSVTSLTRLVITNAVYFKGTWVRQFDANMTQDAGFRVSSDTTTTVKMMQRTDDDARYPYTENGDVQMLEMPYAHSSGAGLSMIVLLPKGDTLSAADQYLSPENLSVLEQSASTQRVKVFFPKFQLGTQYSLPAVLGAMGMPTAFTSSADFSGMDGRQDLLINDVVHKAYVDVNEDGTEAAAATGVVMNMAAVRGEGPVPVFRADHPFVFLIRDNNTGTVLFMGRVTNPS
ncbi:serpin family protein [Methanoregula sp.]|uniref:serpin family protein n=1 Tax=Methanoregula sp. TaxID=2052170 RepID=UPI003C741B65